MGRKSHINIQASIAAAAVVLLAGCGHTLSTGGNTNYTAKYSPALMVTPSVSNVSGSQVLVFSVVGGIAPYHYQIMSGDGSVDFNTGMFTASAFTGQTTVLISDSTGLMSQAVVNVSGTTPQAIPTPTSTTTNCSAMTANVAFQDGTATGVGAIMNVVSISDPTSCASWCGTQMAGYCEWSPNNGSAVCLAWAPGTAISQYTSSWATYSAVCQ